MQHLLSPNGRLEVVVRGEGRLAYDVLWRGKPLLAGATLALDVDHVRLGIAPKIIRATRRSVDGHVDPPVRQKAASLVERYNELRLDCAGGYAVVFRAYDEGVGYRFETALPAAQVKVYGEEATFAFAAATTAHTPLEDGFFSHNEQIFRPMKLGEITPAMRATLPAVVETTAGPKVAIAESDVEGYPGLWLRGTGGPALAATFPPYETRVLDGKLGDYVVIARRKGQDWFLGAMTDWTPRALEIDSRVPGRRILAPRLRHGRLRRRPRRRPGLPADEHGRRPTNPPQDQARPGRRLRRQDQPGRAWPEPLTTAAPTVARLDAMTVAM